MATNVRVAFWNLENLFDRENDPQRHPDLASRLASELEGWTAPIRNRKIRQLSAILELMFDNMGPDLLGVCEVENEAVLQLLADRLNDRINGRDYQVLGHASPDVRGIDCSFIYDHNVLRFTDPDFQMVVKRNATRDLFWATFRVVAEDESFVALVNHWPSRSGSGQYATEPFRILTGETLSYVLDSNILAADSARPVICMGDFNDEPFNRSVMEYALGSRDRDRVVRAHNPMLWNLMWPLLSGDDPGSYKYGSDWNLLDQFLVTRGMARTTVGPVRALSETVRIFRPEVMVGGGGAPRRFGRPSSTLDEDGYSDHFPITVELRVD